jgi:hypothetical protein
MSIPTVKKFRPPGVINFDKPVWFHQEKVESLETFGEFRILFFNGKIVGAVRTRFNQTIS